MDGFGTWLIMPSDSELGTAPGLLNTLSLLMVARTCSGGPNIDFEKVNVRKSVVNKTKCRVSVLFLTSEPRVGEREGGGGRSGGGGIVHVVQAGPRSTPSGNVIGREGQGECTRTFGCLVFVTSKPIVGERGGRRGATGAAAGEAVRGSARYSARYTERGKREGRGGSPSTIRPTTHLRLNAEPNLLKVHCVLFYTRSDCWGAGGRPRRRQRGTL